MCQGEREHPLDILFEDARQAAEALPAQLETLLSTAQRVALRLHKLVEQERALTDASQALSAADHEASRQLLERFSDRKHIDHLRALFALLRRRRLRARMQAIQAALDLTLGLLEEEDSLSQEFLLKLQAAEREPTDNTEEPSEDQQDQEAERERQEQQAEPQTGQRELLSKEEARLRGLDEPLAPIVSSVEQSRQLLRQFEARLPTLREDLSAGNGWFEVFFVKKPHYKEAVKQLARALRMERKRGIPVPAALEHAVHPDVALLLRQGARSFPRHLAEHVYDYETLGPYVKYRWREHKQLYTISLGLDNDYPPMPF